MIYINKDYKNRKLKYDVDDFIMEILNNHLVGFNVHNYIYDVNLGYFKKYSDSDFHSVIFEDFRNMYGKLPTAKQIKDVLEILKMDSSLKLSVTNVAQNKNVINCLNGVLNLSSGNLLEKSPDYILYNCVQANYINPWNGNFNIYTTVFWQFLLEATDHNFELIGLIQEIIGYTLSNLTNAKKAFLVYGESNSGKSVLLNLIKIICGHESVANISLDKLSKDFFLVELKDKLLNVCNELPNKKILETGIFKSLVSETDTISARALYSSPIDFIPTAKLLFATNSLPEITTSSRQDKDAFFNRLIIIPFLFSIPPERQDKDLPSKLLAEKDIIFSWAIQGLFRYINNGYNFSSCFISSKILNQYMKNTEVFLDTFVEMYCEFGLDTNYYYCHKQDLDHAILQFCTDYSIPDMTERMQKDIREYLENIITSEFNITNIFKRLNRDGINKWGFIGVRLR